MPEHVRMAEIEIITDGGRRHYWTALKRLRNVEETLDDQSGISVVVRRNGDASSCCVVGAVWFSKLES